MTLDIGQLYAADVQEVLEVLKVKSIEEIVEALQAADDFVDAFNGQLFLDAKKVVDDGVLLLTSSSFHVAQTLAGDLVSIRPAPHVLLAGRIIAPWLRANPAATVLLFNEILEAANDSGVNAELARLTFAEANKPEARDRIQTSGYAGPFEKLYGHSLFGA